MKDRLFCTGLLYRMNEMKCFIVCSFILFLGACKSSSSGDATSPTPQKVLISSCTLQDHPDGAVRVQIFEQPDSTFTAAVSFVGNIQREPTNYVVRVGPPQGHGVTIYSAPEFSFEIDGDTRRLQLDDSFQNLHLQGFAFEPFPAYYHCDQ
jgi:hypothetical protein